jgi:hypothetical protein
MKRYVDAGRLETYLDKQLHRPPYGIISANISADTALEITVQVPSVTGATAAELLDILGLTVDDHVYSVMMRHDYAVVIRLQDDGSTTAQRYDYT